MAFHPLPALRLPSLDSSDKWNHICPSVSDSFPWCDMSSKFAHVAACVRNPFFYGETMPHGTGRPLFFIHLSVDRRLDYFHLLATVNSAAVNKDVQASAGASASRSLGGAGTRVYLSEEAPGCLLQQPPFYVPTSNTQKFPLHTLAHVRIPSLKK